MDKEFLTIKELSEYLKIKPSTLYSWVKTGEIPHYRIHKMVRFGKEEIDSWMESHKENDIDMKERVRGILRTTKNPRINIDKTMKKSIAEARRLKYTPSHGRSDQTRGLRREVEDGTL